MERLFGEYPDVRILVTNHGLEFWENLVWEGWNEGT